MKNIDAINFAKHFTKRANAEAIHFGDTDIKIIKCNKLEVSEENLNSQNSIDFIEKINPDIVLLFGTGLIKEQLFSTLPKNTINLHLGLSPRYRGAATLFWPFYFLEPQFAGSTFHHIISEPDAGDIIHQLVPKLEKGDSLHDVACKVILESTEICIKLVRKFSETGYWKTYKQKSSGKIFLEKDFSAHHLRIIYNTFSDDIVDFFLESKSTQKKPFLFNQFE